MASKPEEGIPQERNEAPERLKLQLLFIFYKFEHVKSDHFQVILHGIFKNFDSRFDVKIAFSALCNNRFIKTPFLGKNWRRKFEITEKHQSKLVEFRKDILNMIWSDNVKRIKIVCYIVPTNSEEAENEVKEVIEINDPVSSFMEFKKIFQVGTIKINDEEIGLGSSFETFITADAFTEIINEMPKINSDELALMKRFPRISLGEYNKGKLKLFEKPVEESKLFSAFYYFKKNDYLDVISIDDLTFGFTDKIDVKDKIQTVFKNYKIQEGAINFSGTIRTYWIERCLSEEHVLILLDINSTATYLAEKFNSSLPASTEIRVSVPKSYFLKEEAERSRIYLVAHSTDLSVEKAVVPNAITNNELIEAFMHFTFEKTNKHLIVFDLHPIEIIKNQILITEPVVFSHDTNRYGASNYAKTGIKSYMAKHKCNHICKMLKLDA